jgi:hypothetical protein
MTKLDDVPSAVALRLRDFDRSSGFTEQQLLAGLTVPAIADPIIANGHDLFRELPHENCVQEVSDWSVERA